MFVFWNDTLSIDPNDVLDQDEVLCSLHLMDKAKLDFDQTPSKKRLRKTLMTLDHRTHEVREFLGLTQLTTARGYSRGLRLRHLFSLLLITILSMSLLACDDSGGNDNTGDTAGETVAGESTAGENTAGETTAGETSAGETTAGETTAGETTAGETTAGETTAGETTAGETTAGESSAGETVGEYSPNAQMNSLNEEGQLAFCEAFVARAEAAESTTSEADKSAFREATCFVAGLLGGAQDEAACEMARAECLMDFDSAMFTVETCRTDFAEAFSSCAATVGEIEACETATRSLLLTSMLGIPQNLLSCSNAGNPIAGIQLVGALPTEAPDECAIESVAMCQE